MDFHRRVTENITKLNDTDRNILNYILKKYDSFENENLATISDGLFLSRNTIVRFAQKLGYSGFSEMKYSIRSNIKQQQGVIRAENSNYRESGEKSLKAIIKTLDINHESNIAEAVNKITEHSKIVFFALGITKNSVKSFMQRLQVLNKICVLSSDRDNAVTLAKNVDSDFLAFFVSLAGETDALIQSAHYLKQNNVKIISLTGLNQNYIQEISDVSLYAHSETILIDNIDMSSRLYIEFVLDLLMNEVLHYYK